jgi:hypothetical protein
MRRLLFLLVAVATALGAAACGDESAKQRNASADAVDDVVTDLQGIDAPADVQPLHRRLITEISDYGREIRRAKRAFATGAPQRILDAQGKLVDATTRISSRINRTIAAINRQLQKQS